MNIKSRKQKAESGKQDEAGRRNSENGMITVLFIALLAIMMVFVMVESQALIRLRREVKLLEHQQINRLNGPQTNAVTANLTQTK
jgi:hypothetical protein